MKNTKKQSKNVVTGFNLHTVIELLTLDKLAEKETLRSLSSQGRNEEKRDKPAFLENIGACQLFSMSQAEQLHKKARDIFGNDNYRYGQNKIMDALKLGNRRSLAMAPPVHEITALRKNFPNFEEAIEVFEGACALSRLSPDGYLHIPPMLLVGPPGVGKTAFAQAFGKIAGVPFSRIDVGTSSTSAILAGLSLGWSTGRCGEVFNMLIESEYANPVIMLDELDKFNGHYSAPVEPVLLSLLEQESACTFKDEAVPLDLNASHVIWIATANYIEQISAPLRSRLTVVNIDQPSPEQATHVIQSIYCKLRGSKPWGNLFPNELSSDVIEKLILVSPRLASRAIQQGFGIAAKNNRREIRADDVPDFQP